MYNLIFLIQKILNKIERRLCVSQTVQLIKGRKKKKVGATYDYFHFPLAVFISCAQITSGTCTYLVPQYNLSVDYCETVSTALYSQFHKYIQISEALFI